MNHEPRREELLDLALGLLEPAEARALEAHAAACAACRDELASLRQAHRLVAGLPPVEAPGRGAAVLMAAARQVAEAAADARRPRWGMPRWLAGGAVGLAGAVALAVLLLRVQGPPARGPLSEDREALLGQAGRVEAPAAARPAPVQADKQEAAPRPAGEPIAAAAPARRAPPPASPAPGAEGRPDLEDRLAVNGGAPSPAALKAMAPTASEATSNAAPPVPSAPERRKEARAALAEGPEAGPRQAAARAALAEGPAMAPRSAAFGAAAAPPTSCWQEQQRRLLRDAGGRVAGRIREGRYPMAGGDVALRVEERFGADGRLLGATARAGDHLFTGGDEELAAGWLEPLPGVRLARTAAEAERAPPPCAP